LIDGLLIKKKRSWAASGGNGMAIEPREFAILNQRPLLKKKQSLVEGARAPVSLSFFLFSCPRTVGCRRRAGGQREKD